MDTKKVVVKRDVIFNETDFGHKKEVVDIEADTEHPPVGAERDDQVPRRSQRATKGRAPVRFGFEAHADVTEATDVTHVALRAQVEEPATLQGV